MADKRPKLEKIVTPKGIAVWPWLTKPDTKFNSDGEYRVKLKLNKEEHSDFLQSLEDKAQAAYDEAVAEMKEKGGKAAAAAKKMELHTPFEPEYDDEGDETGNVIVTIKSKASGTTKAGKAWKRKINIFNAKGVHLKNPPAIYGGSLLKVEAEISPFSMPATKTAGISLRISAVQVLQLSEGNGGGDASAHGFGVEEGYEDIEEVEVTKEFDEEPSDEDVEGDDGDF